MPFRWIQKILSSSPPDPNDPLYERPPWQRLVRWLLILLWIIPSYFFVAFLNTYFFQIVFTNMSKSVTKQGYHILLNPSAIIEALQLQQLYLPLERSVLADVLFLAFLLSVLFGYLAQKDRKYEGTIKELRRRAEDDKKRQQELENALEKRIPLPPPEQEIRKRYLQMISQSYNFVTLAIGPAENLSLRDIFQPLKLHSNPEVVDELEPKKRRPLLGEHSSNAETSHRSTGASQKNEQDSSQKGAKEITAQNGDDALKKSVRGRMIVLGGPGTGKTTVLQYLMGDRAQKALQDDSAPLPIFIPLPELARSNKSLERYISDMTSGDAYANMLSKAFNEGRAFICLDSLDEVLPSQRQGIITQINNLASIEGNSWIIASRFTDYKGVDFKRSQFTEWELLPMTPEIRWALAERLLPELYRHFDKIYDQEQLSAFVNLLKGHPNAADWGENPLLFSLAAAIFARNGSLPSSRPALYREVINAVLASEMNPNRRSILRRVLTSLALKFYQERGRTFTRNDLLEFLPKIREEQHENWLSDDMADRIIASRILDLVAHDTYGFRHQTFQEYLAAAELAQRLVSHEQQIQKDALEIAGKKSTFSRWTEILRLMVGVLVQEHGEDGVLAALKWLKKLAEKRSSAVGDPGNLGLTLALKSLNEVDEIDFEIWEEKGGAEVERFIGFVWMEALFEAAKYEHSAELERLQSLTTDICNLYSPVLEEITVEVLDISIDFNTFMYRRVALQALQSLGKYVELPVDPLLDVLRDNDPKVRVAAIEALTTLNENVPVEELLATLNDSSHEVRWAALAALRRVAKWVPLELLLAAIRKAGSWEQSTYVNALQDWGRQREDAVTLLLPFLKDEQKNIRIMVAIALGMLGEYAAVEPLVGLLNESEWQNKEEVVQSLRTALYTQSRQGKMDLLLPALTNDNEQLRVVALHVLGGLGKDAPIEASVAALLDSDQSVRRTAVNILRRGLLRRILLLPRERIPVDTLVAASKYEDESVRALAIEMLGSLKDSAPRDLLLAALKDKEANVRRVAIGVLVGLEERIPVDILVAALRDKNISLRKVAIDAFASQREPSHFELLLAALVDESVDVRESAVKAVVTLRGKDAPMDTLIATLDDESWLVRMAVLEAFETIEVYPPFDVLMAVLSDEDRDVRNAAVRLLDKMGRLMEALSTNLLDNDPQVRINTIRVLQELEDRNAIKLLRSALDDSDRGVCMAAINALLARGEQVPLEKLLHSLDDENMRRAAIDVLEVLGSHAPIEPLLIALYDEIDDISERAAQVLILLGERVPVDVLLTALKNEYEGVRKNAASVLGTLGERTPVESLVNALQDRSSSVRWTVVEALGKLGKGDALEPLLDRLYKKDEEWSIRVEAASSLVNLGERASEALAKALQDEDLPVRVAVVTALGERASPEPLLMALKGKDTDVAYTALWALSRLGESVPIEAFIDALNQIEERNQSSFDDIVKYALEMQGERAVEQLLTALQCKKEKTEIATTILEVLGRLCEYVPLEPILALLDDWNIHEKTVETVKLKLATLGKDTPTDQLLPLLARSEGDIRAAAVFALGKLGKDAPLEPLIEAIHDDDWQVRAAAVQALGALEERTPLDLLVQALQDVSYIVISTAVNILYTQGERAVEPLLAAVHKDEIPLSEMALFILGMLSEWIKMDVFLDALCNKREELRFAAAWVLGLFGRQEAIEPLKELLKDENRDVHDAASLALALLGDQTQRESLFRSIDKDDNDFHMRVLFNVLSNKEIDKTTRFQLLFAVLAPTLGRDFFKAGIQFLEMLGELAPVELLVGALRDRDGDVRMKAAEILGKLGDRAPADVLLAALGDSEQEVRRNAIKSLQQTHPDAISTVESEATAVFLGEEPGPILGSLILGTFVEFLRDVKRPSPPLFEKLKDCLTWPYWEVRMKAAETLGKLRRNIPDDVITRLTELRIDEVVVVSKAADEALAEILSLEPGKGIEDD